jgi:hypothetical protein
VGFKLIRKAYKLVFKGTEWDGLEVTVRSLSTGDQLQLEAARIARAAGGAGTEGATRELVEHLAGALIGWNAETEDGEPIPPTLDGLLDQDVDLALAIIAAWNRAMNEVPAPLSGTSSGGAPSVEASIPMDVPSPSLTS